MVTLHKLWVVLAATARALRGDRVTGLLTAQDALDSQRFARLAARLEGDEAFADLVIRDVRFDYTETPLAALRELPDGSLGRELVRLLDDNGFDTWPEILRSPFPMSREAAYAKQRWRETHDLRHVLTGLSTRLPDEAVLHAFQVGQHFTWFSALLMLIIPLVAAPVQNPIHTWARLPEAWRAGRTARLLTSVRFEDHLATPVDELRARWRVTDLSHLSAEARREPTRAALVRATLPWAREQRLRTWWELGLATAVYGAGIAVALSPSPLPLRLAGSLLAGLTVIRLFAFVHDTMHGAMFRGSRAGRAAVWAIGCITCVCPPVWRDFHDRHHHTAGLVLDDLEGIRGGDFLNRVVDVDAWSSWPRSRRWTYQIVRSAPFIALGWITAFVVGAILAQVARDPRRNAVALVSLAGHFAWLGGLYLAGGWTGLVVAGLLPTTGAAALGAWLFFVQHSFPEVEYQRGDRDYVHAALNGSSMLEQPAWMHWFTGNIGYHHIHHLNPRVPFYRLPEVMAAFPRLQDCKRIGWSPRDVLACLRVQAWSDRAVPLPSSPRRSQ